MPNIFSRFADIVSSNINAMLDKAENPSKMIRLIIGEMEDTLVEIKAATAQAMAARASLSRQRLGCQENVQLWLDKARQALIKDLEHLARTALAERRKEVEELKSLDSQIAELDSILERHHAEIDQLGAKITQARERERLLALRQDQAQKSIKVSGQLKRYDLAEAQLKLDRLDQRLDRLEAEAELEKTHRTPQRGEKSLEAQFEALDDSIERELQALKS
ncbi:MAG: PspA/IM30 family protein [Deltaproteobacteria bacterium]|jgi:phage shock protein A|nr:PspA/IM30 family protein [Deltaproteobacteria bacterium]